MLRIRSLKILGNPESLNPRARKIHIPNRFVEEVAGVGRMDVTCDLWSGMWDVLRKMWFEQKNVYTYTHDYMHICLHIYIYIHIYI